MAEPGDLIGPYRLVSLLGKGAMGEVWRARDERLDRFVALKVLPADVAGDLERRARMLREARAAAAIRHGNVVTLFDIVERDGDDILVMELVEGRTLAEELRHRGPPALDVALGSIQGVADALVAAHARGILHRDIKAANIMITPDGVKVLDFGLAKLGGELAPAATGERPALPVSELDATIDATASAVPQSSSDELASYRTHAGQLLGTPLYMAPEQIQGGLPDERSEVFSVGVVAHEILRGRPPYTATTMDQLFRQIVDGTPPPLDGIPDPIETIVMRALAKDPKARFASMAALRDAIAAERRRMFAPGTRRWPLVIAGLVLVAAAIAAIVWWRAHRTPPPQPGDEYVTRALEEYDVFYNEKALSSLRAALAMAPAHPRANAYMILFGSAPDADRARAIAAAGAAREATEEHSKDRALLETAIALVEHGPRAARTALVASGADPDRELAFWTAELDYRAGDFAAARDEYQALLAEPAHELRGRIYDHDSSVLLYLDEPDEALRIGTSYRDAFPGEADAVGVYATTLAAAGRLDEAVAAAEEALRLSEGEDTLAGLAKVVALAGDRARARELYQRSLDRAGPGRRPLRRAALALLTWLDGDTPGALAIAKPCLAGGTDATVRERGACLFVAGVVDPDPSHAATIAGELDALAAAATDASPAYGAPAALAGLVRARAVFFGGACLVPGLQPPAPAEPDALAAAFAAPIDFYAAYHLPFFATWQVCEHAALLAAEHDVAGARALLGPVAHRAPRRAWLLDTLARY